MAIDLSGALSMINSDTVIFAGLAFFAGLASVMLYRRLGSLFIGRQYHADESVTEAVVLEYSRRLRDYDRVIADIRTRIDIMELRTEAPGQGVISQQTIGRGVISQQLQTSRAPQHHAAGVSEPPDITQHLTELETEKPETQNGTTDYILKMLAERPRTSREVQQAVGRTREHTARLMKKLKELGLVDRDVEAKPFRYTITDSGRERLKQKLEVASQLRTP